MSRRALLALTFLSVGATCSLGSAAPPPFDVAQGTPSDSRGAVEPQVVSVIARRFAFEPAQITVQVGQPVRLVVSSADGVHGMEIKQLKVKKDIPRGGEMVVINFTPKTAGEFPIMCSEYCGDGHDDMRGTLVVQAHETTTP